MDAYYLFNGIMLVSAVAMVPVTPQCSESHRIACSLPLLKLGETADLIQVADGNMPILNKSMLRRVCSNFNDFVVCTEPFISACNKDGALELRTLYSLFHPICGKHFHQYSKSRFCYARLKTSYHSCKHKRQRSLERIPDDVTDSVLGDLLCSITGDYVKCVVGITALGCSLKAAELYYILLNETLSVAFEASGFSCELVNPLASVTRLPFPLATELIASKLESEKKTDRGLAAEDMKNTTVMNDTADGGHTKKPPINSTNRTNETPTSSSNQLHRMLLLPVLLIILTVC